jgi:hypothetical protein
MCARRLPPLPERRKPVTVRAPTPSASQTGEALLDGPTIMDEHPGPRTEPTPGVTPTPPAAAMDPETITRLEVKPARTKEPSRPPPAAPRPPPPPSTVPTLPRVSEAIQPVVDPIPQIPEPGLVPSVRYTVEFARARWQRRRAIKVLHLQIRADTTQLDAVLGALGRRVRALGTNNPAIESENRAIDEAEEKLRRAEVECAQIDNRHAEENSRFGDIEADRQAKLNEATTLLDKAQKEVSNLENEVKALREERRQLERQQRGHVRGAEEKETQALKHEQTETQVSLRRAAEELRIEAASLEPEKQNLDRRLAALEKPLAHAMARVEALRGECDACRRSLNDAREGHRHRLAELEGEQARRMRELAQAEAEIQRRLVTLGTLVNLNRISGPEFQELYDKIDELRAAIGARSSDIDRLNAEREAYDRPALVRGVATMSAGTLLLLFLIGILFF